MFNQKNKNVSFSALIDKDIDQLNNAMSDFLASDIKIINRIANFVLKSKGKLVRARLIFGITRALAKTDQKQLNKTVKLAMILELIHVATLLHDDVIDNSDLRRKKASANNIWGNHFSILMGDYLFSSAFCSMMKLENNQVLESLAKTSQNIVTGEILQTNLTANTSASLEDYFDVIKKKTAALFESATSNSLRLIIQPSQVIDKKTVAIISDIGLNLGIMFQMVDDLLDYYGSDDKSGKPRGNDFFERKMTYPVIIAYNNANKSQKKDIDSFFSSSGLDSNSESTKNSNLTKKFDQVELSSKQHQNMQKQYSDLGQMIEILKSTDSFKKTYNVVKELEKKIVNDLKIIQNQEAANYLKELVVCQIARIQDL